MKLCSIRYNNLRRRMTIEALFAYCRAAESLHDLQRERRKESKPLHTSVRSLTHAVREDMERSGLTSLVVTSEDGVRGTYASWKLLVEHARRRPSTTP